MAPAGSPLAAPRPAAPAGEGPPRAALYNIVVKDGGADFVRGDLPFPALAELALEVVDGNGAYDGAYDGSWDWSPYYGGAVVIGIGPDY